MHLSTILLWAAAAAALPAASEEPTRVEAREAVPDTLTDGVFAAAALGHSKTTGFGGGASNEASCDLSALKLPAASAASTALPAPSGTLAYVAVGRGTQNYTCDPKQPQSTPAAVGAVASLFDASCVAGKYSFLMSMMPSIALQFPQPAASSTDGLVSMKLLGHHYFTDPKSPVFNLDTAAFNAGYVAVTSGGKVPAPNGAPVGQNGQGNGAVPWLSLPQKTGGAKGQPTFQEVYRVNTAGGQPPATCDNMPAAFEVQYAAEYWFYK